VVVAKEAVQRAVGTEGSIYQAATRLLVRRNLAERPGVGIDPLVPLQALEIHLLASPEPLEVVARRARFGHGRYAMYRGGKNGACCYTLYCALAFGSAPSQNVLFISRNSQFREMRGQVKTLNV
jgi:hypothetical protein